MFRNILFLVIASIVSYLMYLYVSIPFVPCVILCAAAEFLVTENKNGKRLYSAPITLALISILNIYLYVFCIIVSIRYYPQYQNIFGIILKTLTALSIIGLSLVSFPVLLHDFPSKNSCHHTSKSDESVLSSDLIYSDTGESVCIDDVVPCDISQEALHPPLNFCKHCGTILEPGEIFCSACKRSLYPDPAQKLKPHYCKYCGAQYSSTALKCPDCGKRVRLFIFSKRHVLPFLFAISLIINFVLCIQIAFYSLDQFKETAADSTALLSLQLTEAQQKIDSLETQNQILRENISKYKKIVANK